MEIMTKKGPVFGPQNVRKSRRAKMGLPSMAFSWIVRSIRSNTGCDFWSSRTRFISCRNCSGWSTKPCASCSGRSRTIAISIAPPSFWKRAGRPSWSFSRIATALFSHSVKLCDICGEMNPLVFYVLEEVNLFFTLMVRSSVMVDSVFARFMFCTFYWR